ncbi:TraG/TraD/VirD4 family protein (plasmid) [Termitidicoccus mucosus]|uniref:hypothetical protein n=1 Tax=Termitidicoccus mucosus TaxID=1184151 RepID=UPI003183D3FE
MPRKLVKRFTMEELARIVQMPSGAKLALELSAQLAKYNCVFAFILQDFAQIAHIEVSTLLNNTRQWLITRHDDAKEFKEFAARIQLPDGMRDSVENSPSHSTCRRTNATRQPAISVAPQSRRSPA